MKGKEWFSNGEIQFLTEHVTVDFRSQKRADGTYRTRFGPCIETDGRIFENCNHNVSIAMRRLTRCRGSEIKELMYRKRQGRYIKKHFGFILELQNLYADAFADYEGWRQEAIDHYDDPHQKKALREQAMDDALQGGLHKCTWADHLWLTYVTYKMKKDEWAKPEKEPRMIGDLKVPASLQGFRVTKYLKLAQTKDVVMDNAVIHFCSGPDHTQLSQVFSDLINPPSEYYMAYFSDDSCIAVRQDDGSVFRANLDISSCDSSHTEHIFNAYQQLASGRAGTDLATLVDQLRLPIRIYSLDRSQGKQYVEMRTKDGSPTLYSGSTCTTSINNLANILIAHSIVLHKAKTPDQIIEAAAQVGYAITLEHADRIEDIQFLKHSPVRDVRGDWQPLLNIGVLLRASGTCKGDLPGKTSESLEVRAQSFQRALLQGMYPRSHFPLIDGMKRAVANAVCSGDEQSQKRVAAALKYKIGDTITNHFTSADVYRRYNLTPSECDNLDQTLSTAGYGTFLHSPALSKILEKDYGLSCLTSYEM